MSTVGLTKAMLVALERVRKHAADLWLQPSMAAKLHDRGLVYFVGHMVEITPRGHAALAAPRMTQAELNMLCYAEKMPDYHFAAGAIFATAERLVERGWLRIESLHYCRSWRPRLTHAGRTALNNVRAAMGSPDWEEGL